MPNPYPFEIEPSFVVLEPPKADPAVARAEADERRAVLVAGGVATYVVRHRISRTTITCLCCGLVSDHPEDVQQQYCGGCLQFHSQKRAVQP